MNKQLADEQQTPKRIIKIKVKQGEFFFAWERFQIKTKHWDKYSLTCKDLPRPELLSQLNRLIGHVIEICELAEYDHRQMAISGVSLSYNDGGNRYLVITAQKLLTYSKSPLIINTPARPELPENGADDKEFCWSEDLIADIDELEKEAWKYIGGERAQQTLDFDGSDDSSEERNVA